MIFEGEDDDEGSATEDDDDPKTFLAGTGESSVDLLDVLFSIFNATFASGPVGGGVVTTVGTTNEGRKGADVDADLFVTVEEDFFDRFPTVGPFVEGIL